MRDRFQITPSIFVALIKDDKVFLIKRQNTNFLDDFYDLPGGHLEPGESLVDSAVREAAEETGVKISSDNLSLFHVCQSDATEDWPYIYFMFKTEVWEREPFNAELDKATEASFFALDNLPKPLTPHTKHALGKINMPKVSFSHTKLNEYKTLG